MVAELLACVCSTVLWPDPSPWLAISGSNAKTALLHGTIFVVIHEAQIACPATPRDARCERRCLCQPMTDHIYKLTAGCFDHELAGCHVIRSVSRALSTT